MRRWSPVGLARPGVARGLRGGASSGAPRSRVRTPPLRARVHGVIASVGRTDGCAPVIVGGIDDHVHVLLRAPPTVIPSTLVGRLKGISSRFAHVELGVDPAFIWGEGQALFSVDPRAVSGLEAYVRAQERHHADHTLVPAWEIPLTSPTITSGT